MFPNQKQLAETQKNYTRFQIKEIFLYIYDKESTVQCSSKLNCDNGTNIYFIILISSLARLKDVK